MTFNAVFSSPCGMLGLRCNESTLLSIEFLGHQAKSIQANLPIAKESVRQLNAYFLDPSFQFELPLPVPASDHQHKVRDCLQTIPCGEVLSYSGLAEKIGSGARAVANACRHNPVPIIVPCHRIVAKSGIGGFAGKTAGLLVENKRWLLKHEGAIGTR